MNVNVEFIESLVKSKDISRIEALSPFDFNGSDGSDFITALICVATVDHIDSINTSDGRQEGPDMLAPQDYYERVVEKLNSISVKLEHGIQWSKVVGVINAVLRDTEDENQCSLAFVSIVTLLDKASDFDVDTQDADGVSFLMSVSGCSSLDSDDIRYLIEFGADTKAVSAKHGPVFHFLDPMDTWVMGKANVLAQAGVDFSQSVKFTYWRNTDMAYSCFKDFLVKIGGLFQDEFVRAGLNFERHKDLIAMVDRFTSSAKANQALIAQNLVAPRQSKRRSI